MKAGLANTASKGGCGAISAKRRPWLARGRLWRDNGVVDDWRKRGVKRSHIDRGEDVDG